MFLYIEGIISVFSACRFLITRFLYVGFYCISQCEMHLDRHGIAGKKCIVAMNKAAQSFKKNWILY